MTSRELSILVKAQGAVAAARQIKGVDSAVGRLSKTASRGVRTGIGNIAKLGVVAAGAVGVAVKGGIESLVALENATSQVDGAISQMGLTGKVTSTQVASWANQIEANVGAAFDDKDITAATANLIRFGRVTPSNLKPAMVVMTDLAAKTGSVDSASALLAKALADPAKAAGKLARVGVVLTKEQQKQITAMVKAGKTAEAQKFLLDALAKTTKGAAAATQGPYARSLSTLKDVVEDAQRALAEGFLPVIEKVRDFLSRELAKPETMQRIRDFGKDLAGGLDSLIELAKNLPWGLIGSSLETAGKGAKAVFDAFTNLPSWVQTAVLTGWGLNKLTGGALSDLVGQGLKLTFGQFFARGASPANPLWVAAVGGLGGGLGAGVGGLGAAGIAALAASAALLLGVAWAINPTSPYKQRTPQMDAAHMAGQTWRDGTKTAGEVLRRPPAMSPDERQEVNDTQAKLDRVRQSAEANRIALQSSIRTGDASIVAALRNLSFNLNLSLAGFGRTTTRVTSGTTLTRALSYAGKIIPL